MKHPRLGTGGNGLGFAHVVKCPHNIFPRGNRIPWTSFGRGVLRSTLDDGYFPLGMVISYRDKLYAVCGDGVFWRRQKKLGYPRHVPYPEQWLTEI